MQREEFAGASKTNSSLLAPLERRMAPTILPLVPQWLGTQHLTLLTLVWSALILVFSYLAAGNIKWLWLVSLMVTFQYVTDHFDGKVGKFRNTGLFKWGFYMDHLLDYVFLCAVVIGYAQILPPASRYHMLLLLAVYGGFMVNAFLTFAATEEFSISFLRLGPTEFRLALVIINTLLITYGTSAMQTALPYVAGFSLVGLAAIVYRTHKKIWARDMEHKARLTARSD
jgi:archaetidylinositol phosphate synthase